MSRTLSAVVLLLLVLAGAAGLWQQAEAAPPAYVLAVSWQPAFCESHGGKPECRAQARSGFDATHFTLHGLWPQRADYCGVPQSQIDDDKDGQWKRLPKVVLAPDNWAALKQAMPGTRSGLERHEWLKHGTCAGLDQDAYFAAALALLDALNASELQALFLGNIGRALTQQQIRQALDTAFGPGAGQRLRVACERDGQRRVITELTIGLVGNPAKDDLSTLIANAAPTDGGCDKGIVDAVGPD